MKLEELLAAWRGGLIVSCQAPDESPLARPNIIAALALTAERNGAVGVRIDKPANIHATRAVVSVPVLGIEKIMRETSDVYITPTYEAAARVRASGADMIALDGTGRARHGKETLPFIIARVQTELECPVMADIATVDEALAAADAGANVVGTTLSGYTPETSGQDRADYNLVERLAKRLRVPVICEGRLRSPADVRRAFDAGAFAVVVGTAITGVDSLVREYAAAAPLARDRAEAGERMKK